LRCTGAHNRPLDDGPVMCLELGNCIIQRDGCEKTKIQRAGNRQVCLGRKLRAVDMNVDPKIATNPVLEGREG
jgi:hypothetical protein